MSNSKILEIEKKIAGALGVSKGKVCQFKGNRCEYAVDGLSSAEVDKLWPKINKIAKDNDIRMQAKPDKLHAKKKRLVLTNIDLRGISEEKLSVLKKAAEEVLGKGDKENKKEDKKPEKKDKKTSYREKINEKKDSIKKFIPGRGRS